jgi:hypothetical protein
MLNMEKDFVELDKRVLNKFIDVLQELNISYGWSFFYFSFILLVNSFPVELKKRLVAEGFFSQQLVEKPFFNFSILSRLRQLCSDFSWIYSRFFASSSYFRLFFVGKDPSYSGEVDVADAEYVLDGSDWDDFEDFFGFIMADSRLFSKLYGLKKLYVLIVVFFLFCDRLLDFLIFLRSLKGVFFVAFLWFIFVRMFIFRFDYVARYSNSPFSYEVFFGDLKKDLEGSVFCRRFYLFTKVSVFFRIFSSVFVLFFTFFSRFSFLCWLFVGFEYLFWFCIYLFEFFLFSFVFEIVFLVVVFLVSSFLISLRFVLTFFVFGVIFFRYLYLSFFFFLSKIFWLGQALFDFISVWIARGYGIRLKKGKPVSRPDRTVFRRAAFFFRVIAWRQRFLRKRLYFFFKGVFRSFRKIR